MLLQKACPELERDRIFKPVSKKTKAQVGKTLVYNDERRRMGTREIITLFLAITILPLYAVSPTFTWFTFHILNIKMLPLLEAIINGIHAIEDLGTNEGSIDIYLERDETQLSFEDTQFAPIKK
jgi:nitrate reductase NapE component